MNTAKAKESLIRAWMRWTENRVWAILAILSFLIVAVFLWWASLSRTYELDLAAGAELKYRSDLLTVLREEAAARNLNLNIQSSKGRSADAIRRVAQGDLQAAVVPAGLAIPGENVRQVAVFDCEPLHLFVKPELLKEGVSGLRGRQVNLGAPDSGVCIIATEVLKFAGLEAGKDYLVNDLPFSKLLAMSFSQMSPAQMPDAIFSLCPLPAPLGEHLVHELGYHLMELPFGAAMALRKPYIEDTVIPALTYSVQPAVPSKALHTIGTRAVLIAHANVSPVAIRRLLEVLYDSDYARRVGIPALSETLLEQSGEYPNHAGTIAYLHRHDPWINKDLIDRVMQLRGVFVSVVSALLLGWQWYRRRAKGPRNDYLLACTRLGIEALHLSLQHEFDAAKLEEFQSRLSQIYLNLLEQHEQGVVWDNDQAYFHILDRIDSLQQKLPSLVNAEDAQAMLRHAA